MRIFQEKMVGYPAEIGRSLRREPSKSRRKSGSVVLVMEYRSAGIHGSIKKWNITDFPEFELAITIDRPELYYDFLQKDWTRFCHDYWKNKFFGTSHIESEESDKNLHWKPVLPQPFFQGKNCCFRCWRKRWRTILR